MTRPLTPQREHRKAVAIIISVHSMKKGVDALEAMSKACTAEDFFRMVRRTKNAIPRRKDRYAAKMAVVANTINHGPSPNAQERG